MMSSRWGTFSFFAAVLLVCGCTASPSPELEERPRLVLLVVVDQLPHDRWRQLMPRFGDRGFARLVREGVDFRSARFTHATTWTASGHASLITGVTPSVHGIVANGWLEPDGTPVYSVGSTADPTPSTLLVRGIGDRMKDSSDETRVWALALKDRAAVLVAGHRGNALWYDRSTGRFRWRGPKRAKPPSWLESWISPQKKSPASRFAGAEWSLLQTEEQYAGWCGEREDCVDPGLSVRDWAEDAGTFPKVLPEGKELANRIRPTPFADRMTLDLALELLSNEPLGQDDVPDLLNVGLSASDYVGHRYGRDSVEYEDQLLRLDGFLAELLDEVDRRVGLEHTLVLLTADHGVDSATGFHRASGSATGRLVGEEFLPALNRQLAEDLRVDGDVVATFSPPGFFLNSSLLRSSRVSRERAANALATRLVDLPGVSTVYLGTPSGLQRFSGPERFQVAIRASFHPERSGDVLIVAEPRYYVGRWGDDAANHGSPYVYDAHVPLLVRGPGVRAGVCDAEVAPRQIAPTIASRVGVPADDRWLSALPCLEP